MHLDSPFERFSSPQSMNGMHVFCPALHFPVLLYLCFCPFPHTSSQSKGCGNLSRPREGGLEGGNIPALLPSTPFLLVINTRANCWVRFPMRTRIVEWGDCATCSWVSSSTAVGEERMVSVLLCAVTWLWD